MSKPKFSIIVPVYKVEKYIHRCIDSILSQTFSDFECFLVDDCSPDNCPQICDEYAKKDNRIKVIHKPKNQGLPQARKTGFDLSNGEYIQFVDSDDFIEPDMLEKINSSSLIDNFDIIYFDWYSHTKENEILYNKMPPISEDFIHNMKNIILDISLRAAVWNKVFKREIIEKIEFPKRNVFEDKFIVTQALFYSSKFGYIDSAFYHYIYNDNSVLHNPKKYLERYFDSVINLNKIIKFLKNNDYKDLKILEPELGIRKKHLTITPSKVLKVINKYILKRAIKKKS